MADRRARTSLNGVDGRCTGGCYTKGVQGSGSRFPVPGSGSGSRGQRRAASGERRAASGQIAHLTTCQRTTYLRRVHELTPVAFEVLLTLMDGPQHGYGIKLDIERRTDGEVSLGSGTLYQAIQRLEREGLIGEARTAGEPADPRRGRSYRLLPAGRAAVQAHLRRLCRVVDYARARKLLPVTRS